MMTDTVSLSVVIPAHNAAAYLPEAIASIRAEAVDAQVIVVDDGSTDETARIVAAIEGIIYLRQPREGPASARNRGVHVADRPLLAFLDADDYWACGRIARQLRCLQSDAVDMVFGFAEEFYSDDFTGPRGRPPAAAQPLRSAGTMLIRRDTFLRIGDFPTEWRVGEFIDWYARAVDRGFAAAMVRDVVLHRRLHAGNLGRRVENARQDYVRIVKDALDRRRSRKTDRS